jgi:hypothetical protein
LDGAAGFTLVNVIVGAVVSITIDLDADKLPVALGLGSVRTALFPILSLIVAEFRANDDVPT